MFFVKFDHSGRYLCSKPSDNAIVLYPGSFDSSIVFGDQECAHAFANFFVSYTKKEKSFHIETISLEEAKK